MDPTSVKEPVAAAEVELKATAMTAAANQCLKSGLIVVKRAM
jgi:hypothetical protein